MTSAPRPGLTIHAIGRYLPPLRGNDWWPAETVARWSEQLADAPPPELPPELSPRMRSALEASQLFRGDPFRGAAARPVMPDDMTTADMELLAAEDALSQSDVSPGDIAVVIQHSSGNAHVQPVNAYAVHAHLGLRRECLTFGVDADTASFPVQLGLAEALLAGRPRTDAALLLQSCQRTHLADTTRPWSTLVGDGATAVIVRRSEARGRILATSHMTYSRLDLPYTIGAGAGAWWSDGAKLRPAEGPALRRHFGTALTWMIGTLDAALEAAGIGQLDVVAGHQPDGWTAEAYRRAYPGALVPSTFAQLTSLGACNIPLALAEARRLKHDGPLGLTGIVAGGIGDLNSALVIDWSGT